MEWILHEAIEVPNVGDIITTFLCILWFVWKARNAVKFNEEHWIPVKVIHQVKLYTNDNYKVLVLNQKEKNEKKPTQVGWTIPKSDW